MVGMKSYPLGTPRKRPTRAINLEALESLPTNRLLTQGRFPEK
jgi:hypothetical protein